MDIGIDRKAAGANIRRLRLERSITVEELRKHFRFEDARSIYRWQAGTALPSVENLYALSRLLGVSMEEILVGQKNVQVGHFSPTRNADTEIGRDERSFPAKRRVP